MTAPLIFLRTLIVCLATTLLNACDSGSSKKADIPEINSFHIFTADQTIYSFNEDTGLSTKRGEFDAGDKQFIELNTDESKQGYEYAIYAFENGIYLLNYDKATNGKITKLTQFAQNQTICSIIQTKTASRAAFKDGKASNRSTLDQSIVTIELKAKDKICDPLFNLRDRIDFSQITDGDTATNKIVKTSGSSESVFGGLVIDYSSGGSAVVNTDQDLSKKGNVGFLGHDISYDLNGDLHHTQIVFNYSVDEKKDSWSTDLIPEPYVIPLSKQVSNQHVIVQIDKELFVLNSEDLFTINTKESETSVQSRIDALFAEANKDDLFDTTIIETNRSQNSNTFLIKHDNTLFYFEGENFTEIPFNQIQNETKIDFDLTSKNTALVIQENPDSSQTLLAISTLSGEATTLLTAEKIELQVVGSEFFINTLELEFGTGWQAHWFKSINSPVTYNNSRFIFALDMRSVDNTLFLLSSNEDASEAEMIKPSLYMFDKTQSNGRKKGLNSNKSRVDFSFGKLNTNVSDIISSVIVNDKYAKLTLRGINQDTNVGRAVSEQYFFDPSQSVSAEDITEQTLKLMNRKVL